MINIIYHTFYISPVSRLTWIGWLLSDCCPVQSNFLSYVLKCGPNMSRRNSELAQPGGGGPRTQRSVGFRQCHPSTFYWLWRGEPVQSVDADRLGGTNWYHILSAASTSQLTHTRAQCQRGVFLCLSTRSFSSFSYPPAVACGERGSSSAAVQELPVLHLSGQ